MTSILDQYERASKQGGTTVFINTLLEHDRPMFAKQKITFTPQFPVRHMCTSSGRITLVLINNILLRLDTQTPDNVNEIDLTKHLSAGFKVHRLFVDPTGCHVLVSAVHKDRDKDLEDMTAEMIYVHTSSSKPRLVAKNKGNLITAVGWCGTNAGQSTGSILLGTSRGLIYETELNQSGSEVYWKQVFDLGRGSAVTITGLEYFRMRSTAETGQTSYGVLVTTLNKLYQFYATLTTSGSANRVDERPLLLPLFHSYLNAKEKFIDIPSEFPVSKLRVCFNREMQPIQVGWMTCQGVLLSQISDKDGMVLNPQYRMIPYPIPEPDDGIMASPEANSKRLRSNGYKYPLDVALTPFHLAMVFPDRLRIVCTVSQQLVFEDSYDQSFGDLRGLTCDARAIRTSATSGPLLWSFADYALFRYTIHDESRHIWQIYMEQKQYELALQFCGDNSNQRSQVLLQQAHHCLGKHQYDKAAQLYAQTEASFEEVALKFMEVKQEDALQIFLLEKASRLKGDQRMQLSMLVLWLLELMLRKLGSLKDAGIESSSPQYRTSWDALDRFTEQKRIMECIKSNLGAVYSLLSSHGLNDVLLHLAGKLKDRHRILEQHLLDRNYTAALDVLLERDSEPELLYSSCPVLLQQRPKETVDMLIKRANRLEIKRLTPLLLAALSDGQDEKLAREVIRFVEHCAYELDSKDRTLHTLLFSLYVRYQPDKTLPYLNGQGEDVGSVPYDAQSALRLCLAADAGQLQACVLLYRIMGLYQPAVEMALKVDAALARQTADMPGEENDELRKKLWLRIARHVVEEERDVQRAMSVLEQCPKLLKIEDVLPFFPDFTTIDLFKDAISQSLQEYSHHLDTLKEEMEEATRAADALRSEIQLFRHKSISVQPGDPCHLCRFPLLTRSAYLFPCGHRFHSDCLLPKVLATMSTGRRERVADLQRELASLPGVSGNDTDSLASTSLSTREQLLQDLDDILAADCLLCGESIIRLIDAPFTNEDELDSAWD